MQGRQCTTSGTRFADLVDIEDENEEEGGEERGGGEERRLVRLLIGGGMLRRRRLRGLMLAHVLREREFA